MLYQQALKQLNTIFHKLDIKPPSKKATVRSLVQQKECHTLTNSDFKMLQNTETAAKPLQKLGRILTTWLAVLDHNERARQQQQNKPVSRKALEHLEFMMADCGQILSKSDFVMYIRQHGEQVYGSSAVTSSTKEYKEVYICNQIDFYNTITRIDQDQYFRELEELTQKLGIFQQFCQNSADNFQDLEEFLDVLSKDELFKKKDNSLNRVINYNLIRVLDLMKSIDKIQKMVYYYKQNLTFSLARCYYLCFQSRQQIQNHKNDHRKLSQIKHFLCDRQEKVFTKLYNRKIRKSLIKLEQIQSNFLMSPYESEQQLRQTLRFYEEKLNYLAQKFQVLVKPISENQFIELYTEIQNILALFKFQGEEAAELRHKFMGLQQHIIGAFVNETNTGRRFLSTENIRNSKSTVKFGRDSIQADSGDDIFLKNFEFQQNQEFKRKVDNICQDKENFSKYCQNILSQIYPQIGDKLEDSRSVPMQQMMAILEAAKAMGISTKQVQIIESLMKNLLKLEISEQTIQKIFHPNLRVNVLKSLGEKLVEHSYKLTKQMNSKQFMEFPQNLKKFATVRQLFVKSCQRQLDNIIKMADIISRLKQKPHYDICDEMTFQSFLKVLLAKKQTKAYEMSMRDIKQVPKSAKIFLSNKVYGPFLSYLQTILPQKAKLLVDDLDEIQFFVDFVYQTDGIIQQYTATLQQDADSHNQVGSQMIRILSKWNNEAQKKMQNRKNYFTYDRAQQQYDKLSEIVRVCKGDNPAQLKYGQTKTLARIFGV